jgi:hypothetical protein
VSRRCSETPLHEASDEAGIWAGLLTRLAGGPAREDLAHGFPSIDFSLKRGGWVLHLWWAFVLIWVPLIVVPDI